MGIGKKHIKKIMIILFLLSYFIFENQTNTITQAADVDEIPNTIDNQVSDSTEDSNSDSTDIIIAKKTELTLGQGEKWSFAIDSNEDAWVATYQTDNSEIANIDSNGVITANNIGTATMTVTLNNGYAEQCIVHIKNAPTEIELPTVLTTLKKGSTYEIKPSLLDGYSNSPFSYVSSDKTVAYINNSGIVRAIKPGKAKITVSTYNGKKATMTINVVNEFASFSMPYLSDNAITLAVGQTRKLYFNVYPEAVSDSIKKVIVWKTENKKIAEVSQDGTVIAKSAGKTNIILTTSDGSANIKKISVKITTRKKGTNYEENKISIVDTSNSLYTYAEMSEDLQLLEDKYGDFIRINILANSYDKRHIYQVVLGNPNAKKKIMVQSSIHAREYMTAQLTMKQIEFYCRNYYSGMYENQYFSELFQDVAFYIVPMANPDGVTISQYGAAGIKNENLKKNLIAISKKYRSGSSSYFRTWKANARGVDLNRNFGRYWYIMKGNASGPSADGYKGKAPISELESKALANLFNKINPVATISYHATGSIIYWDFGQAGKLRNESYKFVRMAKSLTYYTLVQGYSKYNSTGFSDWVSIDKKTPAITIEIGRNSCPLSISEFPSIWAKNKMIFAASAKLYQ